MLQISYNGRRNNIILKYLFYTKTDWTQVFITRILSRNIKIETQTFLLSAKTSNDIKFKSKQSLIQMDFEIPCLVFADNTLLS